MCERERDRGGEIRKDSSYFFPLHHPWVKRGLYDEIIEGMNHREGALSIKRELLMTCNINFSFLLLLAFQSALVPLSVVNEEDDDENWKKKIISSFVVEAMSEFKSTALIAL